MFCLFPCKLGEELTGSFTRYSAVSKVNNSTYYLILKESRFTCEIKDWIKNN